MSQYDTTDMFLQLQAEIERELEAAESWEAAHARIGRELRGMGRTVDTASPAELWVATTRALRSLRGQK